MAARGSFLLRPQWLALHVLTVAAIVGMVLLGSWQLSNFDDEPTTAVEEQPPAGLPAPGASLPRDRAGGSATTSGRYDDENSLLVPGRAVPGGDVGWLVMTPLLSAADGVVPVVRGWVPDPDGPATAAPSGVVEVSGVVAAPETSQSAAVGPGGLGEGEVGYLGTQVLFLELPYPPSELVTALLVAESETPGPTVEPVRVPPADLAVEEEIGRWRHLAYGAQWWLFAGAAVVFWGAFVRAGWQANRPDTGGDTGDQAEPSNDGGDRRARTP